MTILRLSPEELNLTKPLYTINEILELMPFGRTTLFEAVRNGHLRQTKVGSKMVVFTRIDLADFISRLRNGEIKNIKSGNCA